MGTRRRPIALSFGGAMQTSAVTRSISITHPFHAGEAPMWAAPPPGSMGSARSNHTALRSCLSLDAILVYRGFRRQRAFPEVLPTSDLRPVDTAFEVLGRAGFEGVKEGSTTYAD